MRLTIFIHSILRVQAFLGVAESAKGWRRVPAQLILEHLRLSRSAQVRVWIPAVDQTGLDLVPRGTLLHNHRTHHLRNFRRYHLACSHQSTVNYCLDFYPSFGSWHHVSKHSTTNNESESMQFSHGRVGRDNLSGSFKRDYNDHAQRYSNFC